MNISFIKHPRVLLLIFFLIVSLVLIAPWMSTQEGVAIRSIAQDSAASAALPEAFSQPSSRPSSWEIIQEVNGVTVRSVEDYYLQLDGLAPDTPVVLQTNRGTYRMRTLAVEDGNQTLNISQDIGLRVAEVPNNNIRRGLDLAGGTRVLLQPQEPIASEDVDLIVDNIDRRLNIFGLSDVVVRSVVDFTGEVYIVVEIAGVNQDEVREILSSQGLFEAYIGQAQVFTGGNDVVHVCRTAQCSGIEVCQPIGGEQVCNFRFSISLSSQAASRMADATNELSVVYDAQGGYLSDNITLFLDGELVDELRIGAELQGSRTTDISISGSGRGPSESLAREDALQNMRQLQTVLMTGSLPVQLDIVQSDSISPILGEEFLQNAILVGLFSLLAVVLVITFRYRRGIIAIPTIIAMVSEVVIMLGFAALIGWRMDLAAIAGIIIAVGTGVDDQIVITDEALGKAKQKEGRTWKQNLSRAFFIILTAYFTTVVAMIPLYFSGAGLLKGFALTTIAGVTIGVLITRPAYAVILKSLLGVDKDEEE